MARTGHFYMNLKVVVSCYGSFWIFVERVRVVSWNLSVRLPVGRYHVSRMDPQVGSLWRTISWPPCCKPFVGFSRSGKLGNWALEDSIDTIIIFQSFEVRLICAANVFPLWSSPPSIADPSDAPIELQNSEPIGRAESLHKKLDAF